MNLERGTEAGESAAAEPRPRTRPAERRTLDTAAMLFASALLLQPWGALLPLRALHVHAQWPDVVFALATLCWAWQRMRTRSWPRLRAPHFWAAAYVAWAALSWLVASPRPTPGGAKLLGLAMLAALFVVTADTWRRPGVPVVAGQAVAFGSLAVAVAAVLGFVLALAGVASPFVGTGGDLLPGSLPRAQAGFTHPNLLASYCIFASAVAARRDVGLPARWCRLVQAALMLTVLLTASRSILAFVLSAALRHATTPARRRLAGGFTLAVLLLLPALTFWNVQLDTSRPWAASVDPDPSPRLDGARTSLLTLARSPLFGAGPGAVTGWHDGMPMDAHFTPLNVAATLGLPALAALVLLVASLWRSRARPPDRVAWALVAALLVDGLAQDVEDFRHLWVALGLTHACEPAATAAPATSSRGMH